MMGPKGGLKEKIRFWKKWLDLEGNYRKEDFLEILGKEDLPTSTKVAVPRDLALVFLSSLFRGGETGCITSMIHPRTKEQGLFPN